MSSDNDRLVQKLLVVLCNVLGLIVLPVVGLYYFGIIGLICGGVAGGLLYYACPQDV